MTGILNRCFTLVIQLHDINNWFQMGQGMGTAAPEAKLLLQIMEMREVVIYEIFLEL